jgi:type II secretory pathway pseudopilin PulG
MTVGLGRSLRRRRCALAVVVACAGFSTVETSAVIGAVSTLTATAAPHLQGYIDTAHATKALGDVRVIALSIVRLTTDVGQIGGHQRVRPSLLVTDGEIPDSAGPQTVDWLAPIENGATQTLTAHLVDNEAGYATETVPGGSLRWRGPYLEGLSADPWGSRYAVNVGLYRQGGGRSVLVLSPGPNKIVETPFAAVGLRTGGDDVIGLIGRAP